MPLLPSLEVVYNCVSGDCSRMRQDLVTYQATFASPTHLAEESTLLCI